MVGAGVWVLGIGIVRAGDAVCESVYIRVCVCVCVCGVGMVGAGLLCVFVCVYMHVCQVFVW